MSFECPENEVRNYKMAEVQCPICGDNPSITELIDYEQFCGIRGEESTTVIREEAPIPAITVRELKERLDRDEDFHGGLPLLILWGICAGIGQVSSGHSRTGVMVRSSFLMIRTIKCHRQSLDKSFQRAISGRN